MKQPWLSPLLGIISLAVLLSCDAVPADAITRCQSITAIPPSVKTDILFVVDDSNSMTEEQQNLAENFDAFIAKLDGATFKNDYQIGITTTSVDLQYQEPNGNVRTVTTFGFGPNAGKPYPAGALIAVAEDGRYVADRPRLLTAGSPTLSADFKRNVAVGVYGSGKEQGLLAAKLAVTDRIADGTNAGFLRPGARLAVVIVTDADDCSDPGHTLALGNGENCYGAAAKAAISPVADFIAPLREPLAGERRDVVVAVIAGVDPVSKAPALTCAGPEDKADRYKRFVDAFGDNGLIDDICSTSFRSTLEAIAGLLEPPQSVPLDQTPSDPRLLSVSLRREGGAQVSCTLALPGDSDPSAAGALYLPPSDGEPARLAFQNDCRLRKGDQVDVKLLCAG